MNRLYLWLRHHPGMADAITALAVGLFTFLFAGSPAQGHTLHLAVSAALIVAIAIRRKWFTAAYLLVIAAGLVNVAFPDRVTVGPAHLAMPILLYTAAAIGPRWARWLGLAWIPVAPVLYLWSQGMYGRLQQEGSSSPWPVLALLASLLAAPLATAWVCGDLTRTRRQFYEELADRAYRLEREREALDRAIVAEERARIARELHDVVAHHVSVMVVQADGAAYAIDTRPEQAREALRTISRTGREAMTELRNLLGVLRDDGRPDERAPQPGLDGIGELMDQVRGAGLPVTYSVAGRPRPVAAGVSMAAYRVVQESLTNVLKHAGPGARATVRLGWTRDRLRIEVTDDGRGAGPTAGDALTTDSAGGHGIIGMRERVTAVGGTLRAGARPGGGYQVIAILPLDGQPDPRLDRKRAVGVEA